MAQTANDGRGPGEQRNTGQRVVCLPRGQVLPELLAAAKNLQENWEHNLTEPMARLNEAIEIAEDTNTTALKAKPRKRG